MTAKVGGINRENNNFMKKFTARQLHHEPQKVYSAAHREPVVISHRSHGDMLLISPSQIFSKHTNIDGTIMIHLRDCDFEIPKASPAA